MGIMGNADTDTALKVPGVELVAVCDLVRRQADTGKGKIRQITSTPPVITANCSTGRILMQ